MDNAKTLLPWLKAKHPLRVVVIGDVILDEYLDGQVNRISPEAPVPVHLVARTIHGAGGAANAARNVQLVGGQAILVSIWGDDDPAKRLKEILHKDKVDTSLVQTVHDRPTIRKTRVTSNTHQIVRIDWEKVHPIDEKVQDKIIEGLRKTEFDAVLLSDYGKGTLTPRLLEMILALAVERGVPAVVDPKGRDFSKYFNATMITPNRKEACDALGVDPASEISGEELGRRLQETYKLQNVLVTMGSKGMLLVPKSKSGSKEKLIEMPATAREVYDVSGAGDTVVAMMTLGLASRLPHLQSMQIATAAAGLVVQKWGTQPVQLAELVATLKQGAVSSQGFTSTVEKIVTAETLSHQLKTPATRAVKVVFTNGCFDILHAGHVSYLEKAKARGDILVVGVNADASVRRLKGNDRPFVSLDDRMRMLAAFSCVDYVVSFTEDTPYELIKAILPDVLLKGADWAKGDIVGGDIVTSHGGVVDHIEFVAGLSTTALVKKILASGKT